MLGDAFGGVLQGEFRFQFEKLPEQNLFKWSGQSNSS